MSAFDASIGIQQGEHFLRKHRAACAGHTHSDDFFAVFVHVVAADNFSLAADLWQVKQRRRWTAVIEFSNGTYDEFTGTFETSGIGASQHACAGRSDRAAEAFAV